jgi:hypothetical protein
MRELRDEPLAHRMEFWRRTRPVRMRVSMAAIHRAGRKFNVDAADGVSRRDTVRHGTRLIGLKT